MPLPLILASSSKVRRDLLQNAGVLFEVQPPRIDEDAILTALKSDGVSPRDTADYLAGAKAQKISSKGQAGLVLGSDQVLDFQGQAFSKPTTIEEARAQLILLRGETHKLHSAAVLFRDNQPIWRHVSTVSLKMRLFSDEYLDNYLARNWDEVQRCVGGYMLESEGVRLMQRIDGDYFSILGLPLLEVLNQLTVLGALDG